MSYVLPGSTLKVYTRRDWNARAPRATAPQPHAPTEAFIHHSDDAGASSLDHLAEQKQHMRDTQDFHMGPARGWSDIAYHFVVFQPYGNLKRARVFEARDWHAIPAAQLNHNTGTLAVCVVGNFVNDELKRNTRYAVEMLLKHHGSAYNLKTVGGHRDVVSTTCPGDHLYRWIPQIAKASGLKVYK